MTVSRANPAMLLSLRILTGLLSWPPPWPSGNACGTGFKNLRRRLSSSRPAGFSCDPWHLAPQPKGGAAARQPGHQQGCFKARCPMCWAGASILGGLHVPSERNPGDHPSRWRRLPEPSREVPLWFADLQASRPWRFDVHVASSKFSRPLGRWLRLLLLLAGDVERNPGPPRLPPTPRGPLDLESGFTSTTGLRMRKVLCCLSTLAC